MTNDNNSKPKKPKDELAAEDSKQSVQMIREAKLVKQMRANLAKRKQQSKARNTKPRNFKKSAD